MNNPCLSYFKGRSHQFLDEAYSKDIPWGKSDNGFLSGFVYLKDENQEMYASDLLK